MLKIINKSEATSKYTLPDQSQKEYTVQSNQSETLYMPEAFKKVRTTAKAFGEPKEEIEQTLTLTNDTEYAITDVTIQETIGNGVTFKEGSVTIDGETQVDFDVTTGYQLPNGVPAGTSVVIKYIVSVDSSPIQTSAELDTLITYTINEQVDLVEHANKITISVAENLITITKTSNKTAVISGDTLLFQNVIENKGAYANTEITFKDILPEGTEFVVGSVKVNEVTQAGSNPTVGFKIDDMEPNDKITVTFEVTVK